MWTEVLWDLINSIQSSTAVNEYWGLTKIRFQDGFDSSHLSRKTVETDVRFTCPQQYFSSNFRIIISILFFFSFFRKRSFCFATRFFQVLFLTLIFAQEKAFSKQSMDEICVTLAPDSNPWWNPHRSPIGLGNYDVNVMMAALAQKRYQAVWFDKRKWVLMMKMILLLPEKIPLCCS